jgi:hypothetical protein
MSPPFPLSVLSNAFKIADKLIGRAGGGREPTRSSVALEAVENKIRLNSQGWEDARIIGERQVAAIRGKSTC